jgi:F-type H+-transporting ATPase subunit gamma
MAGLKEIRSRIASVKTTMQVTSAMKMVSAAKLKKAQNSLLASRPYARKITELVSHLLFDEKAMTVSPYLQTVESCNKVLFVVVTSNRGLCGGFNSSVVKTTLDYIHDNYGRQMIEDNVDFITLGKQGAKLLKTRGFNSIEDYPAMVETPDYGAIENFSDKLNKLFLSKTYDHILFAFTKFVSSGTLSVCFEKFLPIEPEEKENNFPVNYIYEPDKFCILNDLIPKALKMHAYIMVTNSITSEHAARMQAMQQATDNANRLIKDLTIVYNKARQTAITTEILEITGGAEALNNG